MFELLGMLFAWIVKVICWSFAAVVLGSGLIAMVVVPVLILMCIYWIAGGK